MKNFLLFCGLLLSLFSASLAQADLTEQQRIADAEQLVNLFHHRYAPMSWKEKLWKIDRNDLANKLMEEAANAKNDIEFYEAMIRYLGAFEDTHISWEIPSTLQYRYFLDFKSIGKSILVSKNYDSTKDKYPHISLGDSLVAFNGKPVEEEMQNVLHYIHTGNKIVDRERAAKYLSWRPQSRIPSMPQDGEKIVLGLRSATTGEEYAVEFNWEKLIGSELASINQPNSFLKSLDQTSELGRSFTIPDGSFPLWNSFVLRNEKPFVSGIFIANGKRIGFLRLHTWDLDDLEMPVGDVLNFLANELIFLQNSTDALVVDQNNNGGGDICFGEAVAGFFTSTPKPGMLFAVRPTRNWVVRYENDLKEEKNEWKRRLIERQIAAVREALQNGSELSKPVSLCSADGMIRPIQDTQNNKITYMHPVLLLINQNSCSTADMFPAIMQDMGAAQTFGATTRGCGGNVLEQERFGYSDLLVRFTASLAVRPKTQTLPDGTQTNYIENVGVTPDIPYEFSEKDFYDNYESYRKAIEKAVLDLIAKTPASS